MTEQKIKHDGNIHIGANIRAIRKSQKMKQTALVGHLQIMGINMTRETLVKIERGIQHIQASQLRGIKDVLHTTYDELLKTELNNEMVDDDKPTQKKQPAGKED